MIREDFLQQSAYSDADTYCSPAKAGLMLKTILKFHDMAKDMLTSGVEYETVRSSPIVYRISRMKEITNEEFTDKCKELWAEMDESLVARKRT